MVNQRKTSEDLEQRIQDSYRDYFSRSNLKAMKILRVSTGVNPKLPERSIQVQFGELIRIPYGEGLEKLSALIEATGTKPNEDIVQQGYRFYFDQDDDDCMIKLNKLTGIKPSLHEKGVREKLYGYLENVWIEEYLELQKLTGIKLRESDIRKIYLSKARFGDTNEITEIQKATKVKPIFSERDSSNVQKGYLCLWREHKDLAEGHMLTHSKSELKDIGEIFRKFYGITGIKPEESVVQQGYKKFIDSGMLISLKSLLMATEVPLRQDDVISGYNKYLNFNSQWIDRGFEWLQQLIKISGVKPDVDLVQKAYLRYIKSDNRFAIKKLFEVTGVEPNVKIYKTSIGLL